MVRPSDPRSASGAASFASSSRWSAGWTEALIFLAVLLAFWPALHGGFIWDDNGHVTRADLRPFGGLMRIWFEVGATQQYYPLLHSAFWLEHRLWGDSPLGYHVVNLLLHAGAACLFGRLLVRLAVPGAGLAALLFALHPICVESVAWISEQKNTLSAVFYLAGALAWLRFDRDRRPKHYAVASAWFLCALLTKTVTATLPAALLVIVWWQRGRLDGRRDVRPLLPWFALGALSGLFTAHFEHELIGAQGEDFALDALQRCLLAGRIIWFYLGKLAWPADLVFIYPRWTVDAALAWQWLFPLAALALLGGLVGWCRRSRAPLATALLFAGTLFPVLGFFNVYPFIFSYVADHFQYLASLPVFALVAAGLWSLAARLPAWGRAAGAAALLATLGTLTWSQCGMYRDEATLYETTIEKNPAGWMAYHNLAIIYANSGRAAEAIPLVEQVLKLRPNYALAENSLGDDLLRLDRAREAIPHLERALQLQPNYAAAHCNLGLALAAEGHTAEAIPHFKTALDLDPNYPEAELNWGIGLMLTQRFDEAVPHFERAVALDPGSAEFRLTYGRALASQGRLDDALRRLNEVLEINPDLVEAHVNLVSVLHRLGRDDEAQVHAREADRLRRAGP